LESCKKRTFVAILNLFPTFEGYVNFDSGVFKYVYNYTDHLGNVRLSYTKNNTTGLATIMDESHYYPFGLKHSNYNTTVMKLRGGNVQVAIGTAGTVVMPKNKRLFNGKELQDELGLNEYDYLFRSYMPDIGRFKSIDMMADFVNYQSPYVFADNSPMMNIDEDGLGILNVIGNLFKRVVNGIKSIGGCDCKRTQESVAGAWNRPDFPKLNEAINDLFSKSPEPPPTVETGGEGRPPTEPVDKISPSGISMNNESDIKGGDFNIPTPFNKPEKAPFENPIPIIGNKSRALYSRSIDFQAGSTKLKTALSEKMLRTLIKTLVDYPHLLVTVSVNITVADNLDVNWSTMTMVDGVKNTVDNLQSGRAISIKKFLIKRGVKPSQISTQRGVFQRDDNDPVSSFQLRNPKR
jgi:RHS repeat-associated protein